jgi:SsrA-binding protein
VKGKGKGGPPEGARVVARNRKALHDFDIEERVEAGLALTGSEVKSLRAGNVALGDAYALVRGGELFLANCRIGEYQPASWTGHAPVRDRKLLLRRPEIDRLGGRVERSGYTLVPLSIYFKEGWAKVELGLARGRSHGDRRQAIAEREQRREMDRALSRRRR